MAGGEKFSATRLPIAFCIKDVQKAIDALALRITAAEAEHGALRHETKTLSGVKQKEKKPAKSEHVGPVGQRRLREAFGNGATEGMNKRDAEVAEIVAATLARLAGDKKPLKALSARVVEVVDDILKPLPRGPKPKGGR